MNVLKGIDVSPRVVGYARAVLLAAIVAVIEALIKILTGESFGGDWAAYAPIAVLILRALETEADSHLKPSQNVTPAAPIPSVPGSVVTVHVDGTPVLTVPASDPPPTVVPHDGTAVSAPDLVVPPSDTKPPTAPAA
jgi:hypothetical protein